MPDPLTQDGRLIAIDTPLGKDTLLLSGFTGTEGISQLFQFEADLLADRAFGHDRNVDPNKLLGQQVTLTVTSGEQKRYLNGIVRRFYKSSVTERFAAYRVEIVPTMWLMSLEADCRIFANKAIPDVLETMFKAAGVKFKMSLITKYDPIDYCVQYRETGLNFVCRLMEEAGINYWFDHTDKEHTLILSDAKSGHKDTPSLRTVYLEADASGAPHALTGWEERQELVIGKWRLKDLNFQMPRDTLEVKADSIAKVKPPTALEYYDYPGGYAKRYNEPDKRLGAIKDDGEKVVGVRAQESDSTMVLVDGASSVHNLVPGFKVSVDSHTEQPISGSWIITELHHAARQMPDYTGSDGGSGAYRNTLRAVPADTVLRPSRETPKPVVVGLQNAVVVDEKMGQNEEISPDKFGRVKVIFPWDNEGSASAWLRVAQVRAGKSGGQFWLPRGKDEVLVAFMEGDPDQPIVVGSVYHPDNMPPYAQPANKTQSGIKTRSSPGGGESDFNELRFEDKKDSEQIFVQAQKDLAVNIKNDETRTVGHDRTTKVKNNEFLHVEEGDAKFGVMKGNWYRGVKKDMLTTVEEGDYELTAKKGHMLTEATEGDWTINVAKGKALFYVKEGNYTENIVQGNRSVSIGQGNDDLKIDMGNLSIECSKGNITIKAPLGKISLEAMTAIEMKVGQSTMKIDQMGIQQSGMMLKSEGKVQNEVKGLMMSVKADAMLQAGGAITMIG